MPLYKQFYTHMSQPLELLSFNCTDLSYAVFQYYSEKCCTHKLFFYTEQIVKV